MRFSTAWQQTLGVMGDLAHAYVSEFSGNVEGVQYVTHWQSWRRSERCQFSL